MRLNSSVLKIYKVPLVMVLGSLAFFTAFAYDLVRTDYIKLVSLYTALFFLFYKLIQLTKHNLKFLTWIAFMFRAIFILAIPNLSQDFYRFIWDGRMILESFNPYLYTPESFIANGEFPIAQAQESAFKPNVLCNCWTICWQKYFGFSHCFKAHNYCCRFWHTLFWEKTIIKT